MALSTQRHVHVLATDHHLAVLARRAESETRVLLAQLADGRQLLYLLALGNQGQNVGESSAEEGALEARNDDDLASISGLLTKLNDVGEELTLIDTNDIVGHPGIIQLR